MSHHVDSEPAQIDLHLRAIELKNEVIDLVGGQMYVEEADDIGPAIAVQFWENVAAFEKAPLSTLLHQLDEIGIQMPAAETLSDDFLSVRLRDIIEGLILLGVCLENTDHLSDRELYCVLLSDLLTEELTVMPGNSGIVCHTSPIGSGSEEAMLIHNRYYASEKDRRRWMRDFPDYEMPGERALALQQRQHLPAAV